jgi:hypothetical protein
MAGNPLIDQGSLNRVRGSVVIPDYPELTVTAPFLGKEGISLALEGDSVEYLETMTGAATSPLPYMMATCTIRLLKTQSFSDGYKQQMELDSRIGAITVIPDSATLSSYELQNCSISRVGDLPFGGSSAEMVIMLRGYYLVNSALFDLGA